MRVEGLNHVNIVAADLARTVAFYETVLGMPAQAIPGVPAGFDGRWIHDAEGRPIVHVQAHDPGRHGPLVRREGTGAIDHVALTCSDFAGMVARCETLGLPHRINDRRFGSLRQVFVTDPDGVVLECNFPDD